MARAPSNIVYLESPEKGVDGRGWISAARNPIISDGRIGDMWFNTLTHFGFGPKTAAGWGAGTYLRGPHGWTALTRVVIDGTRRVREIYDWIGGEGTKPATGYEGATGTVPNIEDAVDYRGAQGPQALINALDAKTDAVSYETLTALAESASDNEKAAIKRIFEAGGAMPIRSIAELQATSIPAAVKVAATQFFAPSFAVPETLTGGRRQRRVNQEPAHNGKVRSMDRWTADGEHDSANGGWWEIDEPVVTPQMFGAPAIGGTDITGPLQSAVDVAVLFCGVVEVPLWSTPALTGRINVGTAYGQRSCKIRGSGDFAVGFQNQRLHLKLQDAANDSMFVVPIRTGTPHFQNLRIDGNSLGQTSGVSYGIHFLDDNTGVYGYSGTIEGCWITGFKNSNVRAGINRNAGVTKDSWFLFAGATPWINPVSDLGLPGFVCEAWDWSFSSSEFGNNAGNGLSILAGAQVAISCSNFFYNAARGLDIDDATTEVYAIGCSFDHNRKEGARVRGFNVSNEMPARQFIGGRFVQNSQETDNFYSDILFENEKNGVVMAVSFSGSSSARRVKHHIQVIGTSDNVRVSGVTYGIGASQTFGTSFSNDPSKLRNEFDGDVSLGGKRGAESLSVSYVADAVNSIVARGAPTGGSPLLYFNGADANVGARLGLKGRPVEILGVYTATNSTKVLEVRDGGGTLNSYPFCSPGTATARFGVDGAPGDINAQFSSKGAGQLQLLTGGFTTLGVAVNHVSGANRHIVFTPSADGNPRIAPSAGKMRIGPITISLSDVPNYADDVAATAGGLSVGDVYRTGSALKIRAS